MMVNIVEEGFQVDHHGIECISYSRAWSLFWRKYSETFVTPYVFRYSEVS